MSNMKSMQSGRSMIEMLGVLAIIGVLSVGGIAGYSKAMTKFKINKTIDQVSQIVANIRTLYGSQKGKYSGLWCDDSDGCTTNQSGGKILKKAHVVPDEMWDSSGKLENAFGGIVKIHPANKGGSNGWDKAFNIEFRGLPEEACMELATYDWGSGSSSGLIAIAANKASIFWRGGTDDGYGVGCAGNNTGVACAGGSTVAVPMSVSVAATACTCASDDCFIAWKFY